MEKKFRILISVIAACSAIIAGIVSWDFALLKPMELKGMDNYCIVQSSESMAEETIPDGKTAICQDTTVSELLQDMSMPVLQRLSFSVRNVVSCFGFNPSLSIMDVMTQVNKLRKLSVVCDSSGILCCFHPNRIGCMFQVYRFIVYLYALVIFLAPMCTASALYVLLGNVIKKQIWRVIAFLRMGKDEQVILIGDSRSARTIIDNELALKKRREIVYVTSQSFTDSERMNFARNRVSVLQLNRLDLRQKAFEKMIGKLSAKGIEGVILCEESGTANFSLYKTLMEEYRSFLTTDTLCCCRCGNEIVRKLFEDYYMQHRGANGNCLAPVLFSVSDMRVYSMLQNLPVPIKTASDTENPEKTNVHILIGGFGKTGRKFLREAILMGICSSTSEICVDVVDRDIERQKKEFMKLLSRECFHISDNRLILKEELADGKLIINFHDMDIEGGDFVDLLYSKPYDYVSLCIENVDSCVQSILEMDRIREAKESPFRIVVSWLSDPEIAYYLQDGYQPTFISGTKQFLNIEFIMHRDMDDAARRFHGFYQQLSINEPARIEEWENLPIFKQMDNRSLCRHQSVKKDIVGRAAARLGIAEQDLIGKYFGPAGSVLRKQGAFMVPQADELTLLKKIKEDPFLLEMGRIEHRRWCYARVLMGWRQAKEKNDLLKETAYLIPWEELCEKYPHTCLYDFLPLLLMGEVNTVI